MQHIQGILAASPLLRGPLPPVSVSSRSRYVILPRHKGSFAFELRAHNGSTLLSGDEEAPTLAQAKDLVEQLRAAVTQSNSQLQGGSTVAAIECRQSLTGKWYFVIVDSGRVLALSRAFEYRSRMEKALYAVRACAPGSRVAVEA